jgi:hypothetical protein
MSPKLTSSINKIPTVPNPTNAEIIDQYYHYMEGSDISENQQNNFLRLYLHLQIFLEMVPHFII